MDYEIAFKFLVGIILSWFAIDKKNVREDIKALQEKVSNHSTEVAVLNTKIEAVKEDTAFIRNKIGGA